MRTFITGGSGLLGGALQKLDGLGEIFAPPRGNFDLRYPQFNIEIDLAFLCAGTKGTVECEGNREAFLADVDGNIALIRKFSDTAYDGLARRTTFTVFVSTDAVEVALNTAYARNRFMVEIAVGGLPNVAIFRPGRFDASNVDRCARALADVGLSRKTGLTRWHP